MNKITRRSLLYSMAAIPVGCAAGQSTVDAARSGPAVRPASTGQSWRYAKFDYFTGSRVDTQWDRVSATGRIIKIESEYERTRELPLIYPSWGIVWWRRNMEGESGTPQRSIETHRPWGMLVLDPHWSELQAFKEPVPLWPLQTRPGWSGLFSTEYMIPASAERMPWQLAMVAQKWETITVPAGRFNTLRYFNLINFRYTNVSGRVAGQRKEKIWFAPEIGRWVARESSGTFRQDVAEEFNESSFRWELIEWT